MENIDKLCVFWFRRDLRLHDNTGLNHALKSGFNVLPIFIFDKDIYSNLKNVKDRRVEFIFQALSEIKKELKQHMSSIIIFHDTPLKVFEKLTKLYNLKAVYTNHDYELYSIKRDKEIKEYLINKGIEFITFKDQVIFEKNEICKNDGEPYTIFTPFSIKWKGKLQETVININGTSKLYDKFLKLPEETIAQSEYPEFHNIGFNKKPEIKENIISNYHNTRNYPYLEGTSRLSVHLRFGTISIRELVKKTVNLNETFLNELIWREFFMSILYNYPHITNNPFRKKYNNIKWNNNEKEFECWCKGQTGYPLVDAGIRELNETGYMHNRVRMVTASFLCKHLLIDWRWGEAYFAEKLNDYELSSNNGNWQWAAGTGCDAAPYFRIFNPAEQAKRYDPEQKYIKKWVKEVNTKDYVSPVIDHRFAVKRAIAEYKSATI